MEAEFPLVIDVGWTRHTGIDVFIALAGDRHDLFDGCYGFVFVLTFLLLSITCRILLNGNRVSSLIMVI